MLVGWGLSEENNKCVGRVCDEMERVLWRVCDEEATGFSMAGAPKQ
jgi:hypothetical protein